MGSFIILFISMIATWYFAMVYESAELMLLVYLQVALFVLAFFFVWYRKFTIKGRIEVPVGSAEPGKISLIKLVIKNNGFMPVTRMAALVTVEDLYADTKKKQWMKLGELPKGESSFQQMISLSETGLYRFGLTRLKVYDITGLFSGKIRIKSEAGVQVLPVLHNIPVRLSHAVRNFYGEADTYDEHTPGYDNSEIFQVREYQKGDRLQNIHWKLSAKQDDLMVKEHSLPKACPVVIFLDCCPAKSVKKQEEMLAYLEVAASLSFSVTDAGCPHYVVWFDGTEQDVKRFRVDDEESLFLFIGILMQIRWCSQKRDLRLLYEEKYRMETYVCALSLNEKLVLKNGEEVLASLSEKDLERSLTSVELEL